ncbi:MAG: hypothetical protein K6F50_08335 [Kiritimatiellae bacterium]|nr:hypothetical protein [Kiritimatiellia bacterium]
MSIFPKTPTTLITRLAAAMTGEDEANWVKFFELYQPAMVVFVESFGLARSTMEAEDVVQGVLAKLVGVLREGRYDGAKGRFRNYLATLCRNELFSLCRHERARPDSAAIPLGSLEEAGLEPSVPAISAEILEAEWRAARHKAAVRHILEHTALKDETKAIFRELEKTGESCAAVAKRFGVSAACARQIKSRVGRMVAAVESRME